MRPERIVGLVAVALATLLAACASGGEMRQTASSGGESAGKGEEAARVNTELGQKYMQQGKLELALEKLQRALVLDPKFVDAHTVIAVLYERIGDTRQAEEHYRRAAQLRPKSGAENNNYGAFLCQAGRYDEAAKHFERAVTDPFYQTPVVALTNAGTCAIKGGRLDEAERDLRLAVERSPDNAEALFQLASVLYRKGEYFRARAFVQRFESVGAMRPEALLLARNVELQLGNADAARAYTQRLREGFPDSEQARGLATQESRD